jgi:V/A-type H+-transporting ATPase subunit I
VIIDKTVGRMSFIAVSREPVKLDIEPLRMPSLSLSQLESKKTSIQETLEAAKDELAAFCVANYNTLVQYNKELDVEIDLIKVRLDGEPQAEGAVMVMEGWIPVENEQPVKEFLDKSSVYYEIRDTQKGDNPPIKLKNNWFVKMYEMLTDMYGRPSYTEFDPTPLVAPFFSLFFAFCLGDAGYGLVLIVLGMVLKKKMPDMKGVMNLVISLGIFTAVFGTILGTFFGINIYEATWVPEGLKNFMVSGKVEIAGGTYDKQMILALGIGVVHTIIAMLIKALVQTSRYGFKNALGAWGWFLLIGFGTIVLTFMFLNLIPQDISKWALIAIGAVAAIGIYLLNDLHRNVFVNIGAGVWDTYNMATGLMGDILSYMRLYALGLAGGMLGGVFNSLGLMVQEGVGGIPGWVVCCIILVLGHAFNIAMSCISAFVHPLRLNFVEYFKNSGYEGTGVLYKPFTSVDKK